MSHPSLSAELENAVLLCSKRRFQDALSLARELIEHYADSAQAFHIAAFACAMLDRTAEAESYWREAVRVKPDFGEAHYNLGRLFHELRRFSEAVQAYQEAIAADNRHAGAYNNLGAVQRKLGHVVQAELAYRQAIAVQPDFVEAHANLGLLLLELDRLAEAEECCERALSIDPNAASAHTVLGNVLKEMGVVDESFFHYRKALYSPTHELAAHSNLVYALMYVDQEGTEVLRECQKWGERFASAVFTPRSHDFTWNRRLRIGYVSPDFRDHCQSFFTIPLLSRHDHEAFEIFCYSSVLRHDSLTHRIAGYADVWREVASLDDTALAEVIRDDQIDILVDLTMHMTDGRLGMFALKPAPMQVAWLAYPGTTGVQAIDYRLTDPHLDPPENDMLYTEHSVRLPNSFWCYDPLVSGLASNTLPALTKQHITFGSLNNPCKLTDKTLAMWSRVLTSMKESRLLILAPQAPGNTRLLKRFAEHGIASSRISLVPFRNRQAYLRTYHDIDIVLDTFPYNGHTTSLDAMWMGVPVVSRFGITAVSRAGLSQLANLGLSNFAASTDDDFVRISVQLASDLPTLADLRRTLRSRMESSPLMDGPLFAKNVEDIFRQLWRDECIKHADHTASKAAQSFQLKP